jgi:endonuclease-3
MNRITAASITHLLKRAYPDARCSLDFKTPLQLAVATILSAQSTDERVNLTTPMLFRKYRSLNAFADANQTELEEIIKPVGLYHNKAKSIIGLAQGLRSRFGGEIPKSLADLQTLPGVGRKTANVIQGVLFGAAEGIAVDTHVTRLSFRLEFSKERDPGKIETDLKKWIEKTDWALISHLLIRHGRIICTARQPQCKSCFLNELCPQNGVSAKSSGGH